MEETLNLRYDHSYRDLKQVLFTCQANVWQGRSSFLARYFRPDFRVPLRQFLVYRM